MEKPTRKYGFYFVATGLPHDSAAAEMAGMVGKLVGAEVGVMSPDDVSTVQPVVIELQPGEEYPYRDLAKKAWEAFGGYLSDDTEFGKIAGSRDHYNTMAPSHSPVEWIGYERWKHLIKYATPEEQEYIADVGYAMWSLRYTRLGELRTKSVHQLVNEHSISADVAKFWLDATAKIEE